MTENQTSSDFLQTLWEAFRRTSCRDADKQLNWVLMCYVTRHSNAELRCAFELCPPKTEDEALQITDDIESKQRDRGANEKINAVLKDASPVEVNAVDQRKRGSSQRGGTAQGGGGFTNCPTNTGDCRGCGGTAKCQAGRCPAVGATCFECFKTGHLGQVCNQRKARQAAESLQRQQGNGHGNNNGFARPRGTNECEIAGAGYAKRQEYRQFQATAGDHGQAGNGQYTEQNAVGYFPVYQPVDEQSRRTNSGFCKTWHVEQVAAPLFSVCRKRRDTRSRKFTCSLRPHRSTRRR